MINENFPNVRFIFPKMTHVTTPHHSLGHYSASPSDWWRPPPGSSHCPPAPWSSWPCPSPGVESPLSHRTPPAAVEGAGRVRALEAGNTLNILPYVWGQLIKKSFGKEMKNNHSEEEYWPLAGTLPWPACPSWWRVCGPCWASCPLPWRGPWTGAWWGNCPGTCTSARTQPKPKPDGPSTLTRLKFIVSLSLDFCFSKLPIP